MGVCLATEGQIHVQCTMNGVCKEMRSGQTIEANRSTRGSEEEMIINGIQVENGTFLSIHSSSIRDSEISYAESINSSVSLFPSISALANLLTRCLVAISTAE